MTNAYGNDNIGWHDLRFITSSNTCDCFQIESSAASNCNLNVRTMSEGANALWNNWKICSHSTSSCTSDTQVIPHRTRLWAYAQDHGYAPEHYLEIINRLPYENMCPPDQEAAREGLDNCFIDYVRRTRGEEEALRLTQIAERERRESSTRWEQHLINEWFESFCHSYANYLADEKAEQLLKDVLTPEEYNSLMTEHKIDVEAGEYVFRIDAAGKVGVHDRQGNRLFGLCVVTKEEALPVKDHILAKVVIAKAAPEMLLAIGNRV